MAVYAIGDVQGCYDELRRLLDKLDFDDARDRLWFAGDLVNRGPKSLQVLRFVKGLGNRALTVLGNHDLHLLAIWQGNTKHLDGSSLNPILRASDRDELLDWLRRQPMLHHDAKLDFLMVHAGLPPQWDLKLAKRCASEVEQVLRGDGLHDFCHAMYGNRPNRWSDKLGGMDRLRFTTNCLTRLRYCYPNGTLALKEKGAPGSQHRPAVPWFRMKKRGTRKQRVLFGHWSTLGYHEADNVWGLDSGCLWGGKLTALQLDRKKPRPVQIRCAGVCQPKSRK